MPAEEANHAVVGLLRSRDVAQEIYMHLPLHSVPGLRAPWLGTEVDPAVAIHVSGLQLMSAQLCVEDDVLFELHVPHVLPDHPSWVGAPRRQQLLLLIAGDVESAVAIEIGDGERMQGAVFK